MEIAAVYDGRAVIAKWREVSQAQGFPQKRTLGESFVDKLPPVRLPAKIMGQAFWWFWADPMYLG